MTKHSPGALAGEPRPRPQAGTTPRLRRTATWLAWWVLMMSFWVAIDDSLEFDELLVGAGAAAFAALAAEVVTDQAHVRLKLRAAWLIRALTLPGQVLRHTMLVFAALARAILARERADRERALAGRFRERPVEYGDDTPLGETRRVLLIGATSLAPNEFALGLDTERGVMITHQLVDEG